MDLRSYIDEGASTPDCCSPFFPIALGPGVPRLSHRSAVARISSCTLVIPTYWNQLLKGRSLIYLAEGIEQCRSIEEVVLVVGDGKPGDYAFLREAIHPKGCRIVECEANRRGRARNLGAAAARSRFLLFLDDDMVLRHWRCIDVIVSRMLTEGFPCALFPRRQYVRFPALYSEAALRVTIRHWQKETHHHVHSMVYNPITEQSNQPSLYFCFPGCFTLIERETFRELGGFREQYHGWGFEDTDFAIRACRQVRILNLFASTDPLLHIDHPVSPYKAEEFRANQGRFSAVYSSSEFSLLYRRVFSGENFNGSTRPLVSSSDAMEPFARVSEQFHIPINLEALAPAYARILDQRSRAGQSVAPEYVLLHGSRSQGKHSSESDYDLLVLFRSGALQEFFVSLGSSAPVEVEFSDRGRFRAIAEEPIRYAWSGLLELAKVAQARLLWGDVAGWDRWREEVLGTARRSGRCYWLVYALGLKLVPKKEVLLRHAILRSLPVVLGGGSSSSSGLNLSICESDGGVSVVAREAVAALDDYRPDWRECVTRGEKVFEHQMPEVCLALQWLCCR